MSRQSGGEAVKSKSGHSFIKEKMREVDGIYGGEMSAHHYFRDFSYADSGMIPWLLVAELISVTGKSLSELVGERMAMYPASGEINREVADAKATLQALHDRYAADALDVDDTDGYSFEFADWRFNIRMSNTEPVVRLNVESRGDAGPDEGKDCRGPGDTGGLGGSGCHEPSGSGPLVLSGKSWSMLTLNCRKQNAR